MFNRTQPITATPRIKAVSFDIGGTTEDRYCIKPAASFVKAFATKNISISMSDARGTKSGFMGMDKHQHIRALLNEVSRPENRFTEQDVDDIYAAFLSEQSIALSTHLDIVPDFLPLADQLRNQDIVVALNTAYSRSEKNLILSGMKNYGFTPDFSVSGNEVPRPRPSGDMLRATMKHFNISADELAVVGDTPYDMQAGVDAKCGLIVGVTGYSSLLNINSLEEADALSATEIASRHQHAANILIKNGADAIISHLSELPRLIASYNSEPTRYACP